MKKFTAQQVQDAIGELPDFDYYELEEEPGCEIPGFGTTEHVESFGGEGMGDSRWIVFKLGEQLFRVSGYYDSWNGTEWDGGIEEVEAFEIKKTEYRKIS